MNEAAEPPAVESPPGDEADNGQIESSPPEKVASRERFLLLAPSRPLIVELELSIDGRPHAEALEKLVEEVLKLADTDGDEKPTWKELMASKRIKYGQFGNVAIDNENSEKQVLERYDITRDGIVNGTELPRFLTRNAGSARPFSVRGTLDYRDANRRGAPAWRVIDPDGNGVVSAAERAAAPGQLAGRDNDDDEIVLVSDLSPQLFSMEPGMMTDRRRRGPDAVRLLGEHADWSAVQQAMEVEYGGGRMLRADSFTEPPPWLMQLDKNGDGRLRRDEFQALNELPPHVVVAAEFGQEQKPEVGGQTPEDKEREGEAPAEPTTRNMPRLKVVHLDPQMAESGGNVVEQPGRLTISLRGVTLTFYTNDTVASGDYAARARQVLDMFDQNKDGYLEASEVPESLQPQLGRFEAVDVDEDGKAYAHEIERFLAQQQAGLKAQIHAKVFDREDVLFAALDADHDDRLDSREVEGAAQRLTELDQSGDGELTSDELPEVLMIGLARGSIENADATFAVPPVIARGPDGSAPAWFRAMDANQDGAISRREFLGSPEKFAELDKDGNGLLEVREVVNQP